MAEEIREKGIPGEEFSRYQPEPYPYWQEWRGVEVLVEQVIDHELDETRRVIIDLLKDVGVSDGAIEAGLKWAKETVKGRVGANTEQFRALPIEQQVRFIKPLYKRYLVSFAKKWIAGMYRGLGVEGDIKRERVLEKLEKVV